MLPILGPDTALSMCTLPRPGSLDEIVTGKLFNENRETNTALRQENWCDLCPALVTQTLCGDQTEMTNDTGWFIRPLPANERA